MYRSVYMSTRTKIWCMCCMILSAAFSATAAYKTLIPANSSIPTELYAHFMEKKDSAKYYLRLSEGSVAVYGDSKYRKLLENTDIPASSLRKADRAMLEKGIPAGNGRELLALLEDLGS